MNNAEYFTTGCLAEYGPDMIPDLYKSASHLIYSSPASLAFNSPGASGFGVKRAGLSVPGSVMLLVSPGCCGRNTTLESVRDGYSDRFYFLELDDTDIITGRYQEKIPRACREIAGQRDEKPSAVMICVTCVDALLGTDAEALVKESENECGLPVAACYMYALTRDSTLPPMVSVRKSVYSLLKKKERRPDEINILGYFSPVDRSSELFEILESAGIKKIREISRCKDISEYYDMARANFSLVLDSSSNYAADDMMKRLGIPYIEIVRTYDIDKIDKTYRSLCSAIGAKAETEKYYSSAKSEIEKAKRKNPVFSVGETLNADAFDLTLSLLRYGFKVSEIFGTPSKYNYGMIKKIAAISPDTKVYSNLSPSMLFYDENENKCDISVGKDASYYHSNAEKILWADEIQPFGFAGVRKLFEEINSL